MSKAHGEHNLIECIEALTAAVASRQWGTAMIEAGGVLAAAGETYNQFFPPVPVVRGAKPTKAQVTDLAQHLERACGTLADEINKVGAATPETVAVAAFDYGKLFVIVQQILALVQFIRDKAQSAAV